MVDTLTTVTVLVSQSVASKSHDFSRTVMAEAFVYDHLRTPRGKGKAAGSLHEVKPVDLIVGLLDEVRTRNPELDPNRVDDVVLGVVSPIGEQGGDIAKTAALAAGYPETVAGVQLNRFCASGLEAVNQAAMRVRSGFEDLILAGGVESMSRVPMGSDGGAWAADPATALTTGFVPQGIGADPTIMLTGPAPASRKALAKAGLTVDDIDLFEINEAFAAVAMRFMRDLDLDPEKVNVNGGAIALGHPIGMSGARLVLHLALELGRRGGGVGAASLCGGGGQGDALIVRVAKSA
jgi:acetyl-CoA acetyltransferase